MCTRRGPRGSGALPALACRCFRRSVRGPQSRNRELQLPCRLCPTRALLVPRRFAFCFLTGFVRLRPPWFSVSHSCQLPVHSLGASQSWRSHTLKVLMSLIPPSPTERAEKNLWERSARQAERRDKAKSGGCTGSPCRAGAGSPGAGGGEAVPDRRQPGSSAAGAARNAGRGCRPGKGKSLRCSGCPGGVLILASAGGAPSSPGGAVGAPRGRRSAAARSGAAVGVRSVLSVVPASGELGEGRHELAD